MYVPIPEHERHGFHPGCRRSYDELGPALDALAARQGLADATELGWPNALDDRAMHLDPDFEHLTYGDVGDRRGAEIAALEKDDLLVFYAGLRPTQPCEHRLIYAIIGLFVVKEVVWASKVPQSRRHENAHTRKKKRGASDIVVRAKSRGSGRLSHCLPIGEYRSGAYRVRRDVLKAWGGLSIKDGFLQRSARPPRFLKPQRFYRWFQRQQVSIVPANNPPVEQPDVVLVHLRQPRTNDPNEQRSDPFWEFGSFGCTGCHDSNLFHPDYADELDGARLGFAQGGSEGMKLVMLTPPVRIVHHAHRCEARWQPAAMPFRYESAPLLIDRGGRSDFPSLRHHLRGVDRSTWPAAFSSRFRARRAPLPARLAGELRRVHDKWRQEADPGDLASSYVEALPFLPNNPDAARQSTYRRFLKVAEGRRSAPATCHPGRKKKGKQSGANRRQC